MKVEVRKNSSSLEEEIGKNNKIKEQIGKDNEMKEEIGKNKSSLEENSPKKRKRTHSHHFKKWKRKFLYDLKKKEFIPIKGLFFLIYGANAALVPFLTLQARSLGITEGEVGIIYSFLPLASLLAPTLSGMLADRMGNFRIFLSIATALAGLSGVLFLAVPVGRVTHVMPEKLPMKVSCSPFYGNYIRVLKPHACYVNEHSEQFSIKVLNCSLKCFDVQNFPAKSFKNLKCQNSTNCFLSTSVVYNLVNETHEDSHVDIYHPPSTNYHLHTDNSTSDNLDDTLWTNITLRFSREEDHKVHYYSDQQICPNFSKDDKQEGEETSSTKWRKNCVTKCKVETTRELLCSNTETVEDINSSLTFYSHLVIRLLKEFTLAICLPLLEGASVMIIKEHNGDFGFNRLYCNIGMMVMTPISGTLIDFFAKTDGTEDYSPSMYMYCVLNLVAAVIILFLNLEFKKKSSKIVKDFSSMFVNGEIVFFLLATLMAGTLFGYIETFIFWLLEDLGANKKLMGITITIGSVFGIPILMVSTFIIKKLGHVNTIVLGFVVYIIRLIGYTVIPSPWLAMPFEAMECVTVSLMVVTFVSYASLLATPSTVVTLQGMYVGLYNGVGKGAGSLMGGYLIEAVGITVTFRIMAAIAGFSGGIYFAANLLLFYCRKKKNIKTIGMMEQSIDKVENDVEMYINGNIETGLDLQTGERFEINGKTSIENNIEDEKYLGIENKGFRDD